MLNGPVLKLWLTLEARVPPVPALAPAAEIMPGSPPGIFTVTWVSCQYPTAGVKTAESPLAVQLPAICGESVGIGELAASRAENRTWMVLAPLTPFALAAGVMDTTCSAGAGLAGLEVSERLSEAADATSDAWLPGAANATIAMPETSTSAALPAVRAAPRLLPAAGPLAACLRGQIPLAEVPLFSRDCCLRNHPDPDTAPVPST